MKIRTRRNEYLQIKQFPDREDYSIGIMNDQGTTLFIEMTDKELKETYRELRELVRLTKI